MKFDSAALFRALTEIVPDFGERDLCVAFSGGLDSTILLFAAHAIKSRTGRLRAVHVHHGLVAEAEHWARRARATCAELAVECTVLNVNVAVGTGDSLEEQARVARYAALEAVVGADEILLTAQHRDDQLETLLLQLFRGAGVAGLASMPPVRAFGAGLHARPLLTFDRCDLHEYAERHGLRWQNDPSNEDQRFDRNFLRGSILPALRARWPGIAVAVARSASNCAEAQQLLDQLADLDRVDAEKGGELSVTALRRLSPPRQRNLLRRWIAMRKIKMPPAARLNSIITDVIGAADSGAAVVSWGGMEARRFQDRLLLVPELAPVDTTRRTNWPRDCVDLELGSGQGYLHQRPSPEGGIDASRFGKGLVEVGYRRGGERLRIHGKAQSKPLSRLFQEAQIFPWMRDRVPLIFIDGSLAAVADLWIVEGFVAEPGSPGLDLQWFGHPPIR